MLMVQPTWFWCSDHVMHLDIYPEPHKVWTQEICGMLRDSSCRLNAHPISESILHNLGIFFKYIQQPQQFSTHQ